MVSTRSKASNNAETGEKRAAPATNAASGAGGAKRTKKEKNGKLEVGDAGEVGLKKEGSKEDVASVQDKEVARGDIESKLEPKAEKPDADSKEEQTDDQAEKTDGKESDDSNREARTRSGPGETKQEGDEIDTKTRGESPGADLEEPKHGTLESGHIYFLYRPKIDTEDVDSIDDISKFHILLIPKSAPHDKGHYHRIIEVGKKKLPDPGAKHQVIWGLVGGVGTDPASLKEAFGAYSYETKTRGTRHQEAARPAARGHYILHSPRDELADDPSRNRQRDFKMLLAYEITTPTHEDFGNVQTELGIEEKGAVVLQVKDPNVKDNSNNPRAANMPREKKAHFPPQLQGLFENRRWIPANPPTLLNYQGAEILILTSPHTLEDSLGKDGEQVEHDLDDAANQEKVGTDGAMKELGMSKKDTEIEALEGHWA